MFLFAVISMVSYLPHILSHIRSDYRYNLILEKIKVLCNIFYPCADVVKLVDTMDLGSIGESHGGSSPFIRTNFNFFKVR